LSSLDLVALLRWSDDGESLQDGFGVDRTG
jgi:hypothetical protein